MRNPTGADGNGAVIHHVTSIVRNMERTLDFYRLAGIPVDESENDRGFVSIDRDGDVRCWWMSEAAERSVAGGGRRSHDVGSIRIGLRCTDPAAVDTAFRRLVESGHPSVLEPVDAPWGARVCRVLDPDGNTVELFAPLP